MIHNETMNTVPNIYHLRGRFWIESPQGTFLGQGRVALLERIREHGSISAAARSIEMSYRQAWALVNSMNTYSHTPLVSSATGGRAAAAQVLPKRAKKPLRFTTLSALILTLFWQNVPNP